MLGGSRKNPARRIAMGLPHRKTMTRKSDPRQKLTKAIKTHLCCGTHIVTTYKTGHAGKVRDPDEFALSAQMTGTKMTAAAGDVECTVRACGKYEEARASPPWKTCGCWRKLCVNFQRLDRRRMKTVATSSTIFVIFRRLEMEHLTTACEASQLFIFLFCRIQIVSSPALCTESVNIHCTHVCTSSPPLRT